MPRGKRGPVPPVMNDPAPEDPTAGEIVGSENVVHVGSPDDKVETEEPDSGQTANPSSGDTVGEVVDDLAGMYDGAVDDQDEDEEDPEDEDPEQPELFSEPSGLVFRSLQTPFSEERLTELHAELGEICSESLAAEELVEATKDKIKSFKTSMQEIRAKIRHPFEYREIECRWVLILEENAKVLIRTDTQEVIDRKALSAEDRASELARVEAENSKASADSPAEEAPAPAPEPEAAGEGTSC